MASRTALFCSALLAASGAAYAGIEYQTIPGVSPEPIAEGAGLKSPEELETFLDGVMTAQMRAQRIAGAVVAVVKDGKPFFVKGYGYADVKKKIPVDPDKTLFRPGSVSKIFTWTALMQMVERGKVQLDGDVNQYLTQFQIPDTYPGQPITTKHLLTHTVGMEDGGFGYLIVKDPAKMEPAADALANHLPARVRAPAGGDWTNATMASYSNWGTALAGLIVANLSGMSYEDYVDQHILAPLGMTQSSARQPLPAHLEADMSVGYKFEAGQLKAQHFEYVNLAPAGSMSASGSDMARFMIAHLNLGEYNGQRILREETAKLMQSRTLSPNPHLNGAALGFYENHVNGRRVIVHGGDTAYFHSEMNLLPEEGIGIFVSHNSAAAVQFPARTDLFRAFMDRYYPAKLPDVQPPADFKTRAAQYAGSYRIIRHSYTTYEKAFAISSALKVFPTDRNTLVASFGPYTMELAEVKPNVFRRVDRDDMVAFSDDAADGRTYMLDPLSLPNHMAYRLAWYETPATLGLIAGFAVLCFVVAVVSALRHWKADRAAEPNARRARRLAALVSGVQLAFVVLAGTGIAILSKDPWSGLPSTFYVALALPLIAIPLTLGLFYFVFLAWKGGWWSRYGRVQYTAIAAGCTAFLWVLSYANLLGYRLG